jgi:hypothetical protein
VPTALHLPFAESDAKQVGRQTFRKQILPVGSLDYEGRKLDFTPDYLTDLASKFNAGAFDQVPFVLVNDQNEHVDDPEQFRGEVKAMEVDSDGLYGLIELTPEGAKLVHDNPRLGVSPRIREDIGAIEHVAGTLRPRTEGMGVKPWEQVELSGESADVVDLTEAEITEPEASDPPSRESSSIVSTATAELSAEDAERIVADLLKDTKDEPAKAELSDDQKQAIELADKRAREADERARAVQAELANERFDRKSKELIAAGVPPKLVNLAEPVLRGEAKVIELSDGKKVDASNVVSELLDECKGIIDFSTIGVGGGEPSDEVTEAKEKAAAWAKEAGS